MKPKLLLGLALVLSGGLLASPLAIDAADTNSWATLVRSADLVAHVQATQVECHTNIIRASLTFSCSAICVVKETVKGESRKPQISVYYRIRNDPVFAAGKDYIVFLFKDGTTNQLGQEGFGFNSYPREDAQQKAVRPEVQPYSLALWDEIRTNALPRSNRPPATAGSDH